MSNYFAQAMAKRRKALADDLITYLLRAEIDGQPLTDEHIIGTLRLLLIAGIDTTWSAIGSCLWHLATHAQDRHGSCPHPTWFRPRSKSSCAPTPLSPWRAR
jgi:cytochrome P450